jgi:hypothetical protein
MDQSLLFVGRPGGPEIFLLIVLPLLYVVPIWLSFRKYREGEEHWRGLSILATLLLSWVGYILIGSIRAGAKGYVEGRIQPDSSDRN